MKHIAFPSINQFRNIVHDINHESNRVGTDDNGDPIYDATRPKPVLTFKGTVKLHGTNAAVCYNQADGLWVQSRENIITPLKDNAGFAFFVKGREESFIRLLEQVYTDNGLTADEYTVSIYGEWCGGNIQQGVGIANLEKSFFIFGVKISKPEDESFVAYWVDSSKLSSAADKIYNIESYKTWTMTIDFNNPQKVQNDLIEITENVEAECPVAKAFGYEGIGEGVVWATTYKGAVYRFKVKGEKHSSSKVKVLAGVDAEKLESIDKFLDYAVSENRFEQAIAVVFGGESLDVKKVGDLIRWMVNDIVKEESDTMVASNIEPKSVASKIADRTRTMFFKRMAS